jgi:predicted Fe-Mo cluster-binding NifX family protein
MKKGRHMKRIRICIGSNDSKTIAKTHMGDTEYFLIYDLFENSQNRFIEKRINIAKDMKHGKTDKMEAIIKIVEDTDVFVAQQKSPNFVKIANTTKYQPVVVNAENIADVLILLDKSFQEICNYTTRRNSGEYFNTIPELK